MDRDTVQRFGCFNRGAGEDDVERAGAFFRKGEDVVGFVLEGGGDVEVEIVGVIEWHCLGMRGMK